jgi:hypothetical protein
MFSVMVSAEEAVQTKALHMNFHSYEAPLFLHLHFTIVNQ